MIPCSLRERGTQSLRGEGRGVSRRSDWRGDLGGLHTP